MLACLPTAASALIGTARWLGCTLEYDGDAGQLPLHHSDERQRHGVNAIASAINRNQPSAWQMQECHHAWHAAISHGDALAKSARAL